MAFTVTRLLALGIAALLALAAATPAAALPNLAARRRLTGLTQDPNVVLFDADQDGVGDTISVKDAGSNTYQYFASELREWVESPPEGCSLETVPDDASWSSEWVILMQGPETAPRLYADDVFRLRVRFSDNYPLDPPEFVFLPPAPVHPHVFSCGHICMSLFYSHGGGDFSPALTVSKLCLALRSMLASATARERPPGDADYCRRVGHRSPKETRWDFHDDKA